jgi:ABC-2 type transport system ATP-binding protein
VLVATELTKRYGDTTALDGCSLRAERGRMLGFLGPNGAGKTTAMRAVFGLVALDRGEVSWEGRPVDAASRVRFGYMPEQRGLYPKMRLAEQLTYLARLHGVPSSDAGAAADRWLAELGLTERRADPLEALSHGNQQRVQLAAALVHDPELLVLDEPFSGLDPIGVDAMERVLRDQAARGAAIVFSSHQLDLVQSICDDVVIVHRGRDILAGTLDELRSASRHRRVEVSFATDAITWSLEEALPDAQVLDPGPGRFRLLVPHDRTAEEVLALARSAGEVRAFTYEPPTLSELFLEAVAG